MSIHVRSICVDCWNKYHPDKSIGDSRREFIERQTRLEETVECCYCGAENRSGLYVREMATSVRCQGQIGIHTIEVIL